MVRVEIVPKAPNKGIIFREHALAHQYCVGRGVELGAAAHNAFNLNAEVLNVAPYDDDPTSQVYQDFAFYRDAQVDMCGAYALVDLPGTASAIPVEDSSLDFVISSHVIEHEPNLIASFIEAYRVLKDGGILFIIVPKRNALPKDRGRAVSTLEEMLTAMEENWTLDTAPLPPNQGKGGHYWIFTLQSLLELVQALNTGMVTFQVVATEETDSKVGNGHTLVLKKIGLPDEPPPKNENLSAEQLEDLKSKVSPEEWEHWYEGKPTEEAPKPKKAKKKPSSAGKGVKDAE